MPVVIQYEELSGADGPRARYRPERFQARALYGQFPPQVEIGGIGHPILDLSMSGLAIAVRRDQQEFAAPGDELDLRIVDQDTELYRGRARVCRVESTPFHTKVALHLTGGYLDIPQTVVQHTKLLTQQIVAPGAAVDARYREHCADVLHMLRRYRAALAEVDQRPGLEAIERGRLEAELLPLCEERLLPEWRDIWRSGNALAKEIMKDPEALRAAKRYTELMLTPEFMPGPLWRRGYEKPLGYPGDFEMMNSIYARVREGDTPYGKLLHRLALEVGECISARLVEMERAIVETVAGKPIDDPVRITSVGCGSAREVENYLRIKSRQRRVEFTLIDQSEEALSYAYGRTYPEVVRLGGDTDVRGMQVSFSQLMKAGRYFQTLPPQDLIYSAGLADYLSPKRVRCLISDLYEQLAPGGLLVVANMGDAPLGTLWPLEFICDWTLTYRDAGEMEDLARGFDPSLVEVRVTDPTGQVVMLRLRKPG